MLPSILSSYLCLGVLRLGMVIVAKEKPPFCSRMDLISFLATDRLPIFYIEIVRSWLRAVREGMHSLSLSRRPSKANLPSSGTQHLPFHVLFIAVPRALAAILLSQLITGGKSMQKPFTVATAADSRTDKEKRQSGQESIWKRANCIIPHWPGKTSLLCIIDQYSISILRNNTDLHRARQPVSV